MTVQDNEHGPIDMLAADQAFAVLNAEANRDNLVSVTESNRALAGYNLARARLRLRMAAALPWVVMLAIAWSVYAWTVLH